MLTSIVEWASRLKWRLGPGQVSFIELAIDFEASTRILLESKKRARPSIRERALILKKHLANLNKTCAEKKLSMVIPADVEQRVHSLRTIGGPVVLGYNKRPEFLSGLTTILEEQLAKIPHASHGWGNSFIPVYPPLYQRGKKRRVDSSTSIIK